ncbi:hypothetical protein [Solimonas soli]|uniref:hypothetical protein n=1 Tax=Solimonas soli TaxID=413479 RepID=UPI0006844EBD|nr:hypothetical protein [Solimonas soli]
MTARHHGSCLCGTAGQDQVGEFTLPGTRHHRVLRALRLGAAERADERCDARRAAGSLASDLPLRPDAHLFCASRANWDDALETLPKFQRLPG